MVEANTELLAGAAVTVFLALLFFGVVVLWDVALALRSVGDKIDKLEDNIDDDLTDISHHLDGMSNAPGSGGGTQLHLSSGTISSGPGVSQPQQAPQTGQPQAETQQAATGQSAPQSDGGPQPQSAPQQADHRSQMAGQDDASSEELNETADRAESAQSAVDEEATAEADSESDVAESDEPDADESASDEAESDKADGNEPDNGESGSDEEPDTDDEPAEHPRAQRNRGRFITSPDRTAWYATPLDRAGIAAAQPEIAGALPDGSDDGIDDAEVIAAGPVGSSPAAETDDHDENSTPDEQADDDDEVVDDATGNGDAVTGTDPAPAARDPSDRGRPESDGTRDENSGEDVTVTENGAEDDTGSADGHETADDTERETDTENEVGGPGDPVPEAPAEMAVHTSGESADTDHTEASDGIDEPSESVTADDAASDTGDEPDGEIDADSPPAADALSAFEFDEDELEVDDDVTVAEAVETMNEAAPAPELSSHRFDVTAEGTDDGGAVVTLAFEDDTVDVTGSTKRLLQYQLQSFSNRESTPDGEVTIGRNRIVIELPDADGTAIQQWGDAAVSIVDRTLYLSDNSSDSYSNN